MLYGNVVVIVMESAENGIFIDGKIIRKIHLPAYVYAESESCKGIGSDIFELVCIYGKICVVDICRNIDDFIIKHVAVEF